MIICDCRQPYLVLTGVADADAQPVREEAERRRSLRLCASRVIHLMRMQTGD